MQIEINDIVWYIWKNQIYKGRVITENSFDGMFRYYQVETYHGLQVFAQYELFETKDQLINAITYESLETGNI